MQCVQSARHHMCADVQLSAWGKNPEKGVSQIGILIYPSHFLPIFVFGVTAGVFIHSVRNLGT